VSNFKHPHILIFCSLNLIVIEVRPVNFMFEWPRIFD